MPDSFDANAFLKMDEILPAYKPADLNPTILSHGFWKFHSYLDKRWCIEGNGLVGGPNMCKEARAAFLRKKEEVASRPDDARTKKFGNPPYDLVYWIEPAKDLI